MKFSSKILEDGSILRELISEFQKNRCQETGLPMLACLRDSVLWIPTTAILSERDEAKVLENLEVGNEFTNEDPIRFRPGIIRAFNGDAWFPALSSVDQGDDSNHGISYIPLSALECLEMAHSYDVPGICLDPYTLGLALPFEIVDIIRELPSNIE